MTLDSIDRRILLELQKDGRLTNQELADRVGLSPSPCLRRVRLLQEAGVIERYAAVLSQDALGLSITAFARLTLLSHTSAVVDEVERRLRSIPEVVEAYLLAGDDDYLVKIVIESFAAYEDLLRREIRAIPSLASIKTTFAFAVTKPQSPLPIP
ncbi:Lrp/AsnC family transcriptional regulator [Actinoplanes ianthinogenes]|uniref:AsnC family transcriptional regulator n=1 Tax=Actinoplanes ianthinogenes TaxID=122358 RepID=A0ABM7LNE1_9ACTN|nr:Lrp/AsnC family transcriptional regulator [Actinoplanes ianthinogenes]BCJ40776.1 AsnC family transcriptional regulator [Actinoplanes ianthinogenes]